MIVYTNPEAYEQIIFGGETQLTEEEIDLIYGEGIGSLLMSVGKTAMRGLKTAAPFLKSAGKHALKFAKSPLGQKMLEMGLSTAGQAILSKIQQNRAEAQGEGLQPQLTEIYNTIRKHQPKY